MSLSCLQAGRYWAELVGIVGRPELADDERFADAATIRENAMDGVEHPPRGLRPAHRRRVDARRSTPSPASGPSSRTPWTCSTIRRSSANRYIVDSETSSGTPFKLAAAPVTFGDELPATHRAPEFNEHGDEILESLGYDWDAIIDLKVRGVVA